MHGCTQSLTAGHFFGRRERLVKTLGLVLSEVRYEPGQRVPPHGHELSYFCLLVDGGYWEQYGRRRVDYSARSIVFHPPGTEHHGDIGSKGGRCFNIELLPELTERIREEGPAPASPIDFRSGDLVWLATRLYREFREASVGSPLVAEGLGLEMVGRLLRRSAAPAAQPPRWMKAAVDRLHDELDRPLTVSGVAADLGVSPVRLSQAFRRFRGETLGECLRRLRVERACQLLENPEARLADIAVETGFADQSHFTRVFKRLTGLTPGRYRRQV